MNHNKPISTTEALKEQSWYQEADGITKIAIQVFITTQQTAHEATVHEKVMELKRKQADHFLDGKAYTSSEWVTLWEDIEESLSNKDVT